MIYVIWQLQQEHGSDPQFGISFAALCFLFVGLGIAVLASTSKGKD